MASLNMPGGAMPGDEAGSGDATVVFVQMPGERPPVLDFVRQIYFEGLPLDEAATYGPEDVPALLDLLADPAEAVFHENAALTLAMIGDESAVAPLIACLESESALDPGGNQAEARRAAFRGRVGALIGLGYLANLTGADAALDFLQTRTDPASWSDPVLDGLAATVEGEAAGGEDLSRYAVLALGVSGRPEAAEHLRTLEAGPELP